MTIVNVAFAGGRALIVTDEIVVEGQYTYWRSKALALPHLQAVFTFSGHLDVGMDGELSLSVRTTTGMPLDAVAGELTETLQRSRQRHGITGDAGRAILIGWHGERIAAFELWSCESFACRELPAGVYVQPGIQDADAPLPAGRTWADLEAVAIGAVEHQRRQQKVPSGGRLHLTRIGPRTISVSWTDELPEVGLP